MIGFIARTIAAINYNYYGGIIKQLSVNITHSLRVDLAVKKKKIHNLRICLDTLFKQHSSTCFAFSKKNIGSAKELLQHILFSRSQRFNHSGFLATFYLVLYETTPVWYGKALFLTGKEPKVCQSIYNMWSAVSKKTDPRRGFLWKYFVT